jgi:peptidoglycan-associated lipoprotein
MIEYVGRLILPLAAATFLAACASQQPQQSAQPEPVPAPATAHKPAAPPTSQPVPVVQPAVPVNPLSDPSNILSKRSIYFDYDNSDIKPEFRSLIEAHAKYVRDHPGASVTIQGNTDERGSPEYNIALGQRRSEAVMRMMRLLGVPEHQMEAISLGKEKPKALGHDEASWAENRRSDIAYQRKE